MKHYTKILFLPLLMIISACAVGTSSDHSLSDSSQLGASSPSSVNLSSTSSDSYLSTSSLSSNSSSGSSSSISIPPLNLLNDEVLQTAQGDVQFTGTITYTVTSEKYIFDVDVRYNENFFYRQEFDRDLNRVTYTTNAFNDNGYATYKYLGADNRVNYNYSHDTWENYINPFDSLKGKNFEKYSTDRYILASGYIKSSAQMLLGYIEDYTYTGLEVITADSQIVGCNISGKYVTAGTTYSVVVALGVQNDHVDIPEVLSYAKTEGHDVLQNAFNELDLNYTMEYVENASNGFGNYTDYFTETAHYSTYQYTDENGYFSAGRLAKDGNLYEFINQENQLILGEELSDDDTDILYYLPFFFIAAEVFEVIDENTHRAYDEVAGLICLQIMGINLGVSNMILELSDSHLDFIEFDFNFDGYSLGSVKLNFVDVGSTAMPFDISAL